jgi:hypothetical protein
LPKSFDRDIFNVDVALPLREQQTKVQQMKRSMLDDLVQDLEIKLLDYAHQYERELMKLEKSCSDHQHVHGILLFDYIKTYMSHQTDQFKHGLSSNMILFRKTLHRRHRRCRSSIKIDTFGVWPQVIVDVPTIPLNDIEFSYISSAGSVSFWKHTVRILTEIIFLLCRPQLHTTKPECTSPVSSTTSSSTT